MLYRYRVYHRAEGVPPMEAFQHPFDEERKLYEYEHFPTSLDHHYSAESAIAASSEPATPAADGVIVILRTELPESQADDSLTRCLRDLNRQIPGLCLVAEKIRP